MKQLIAALVMASAVGPLVWSQAAPQGVSRTTLIAVTPVEDRGASIADTDDAADNLAELDVIHGRLMEAAGRMTTIYSSLNEQINLLCGPDGDWDPSSRDEEPLDQICRTSVHDTLEYLELHNGMKRDSRRYHTLSNIMKTRHDTAKSAIQNVR
jgi:hypothetical protein